MGKKKDAALHGMSKKDRKKLEAREAELAAELERRKAKKAGKKKGKKARPGSARDAENIEAKAAKRAKKKGKKAKHVASPALATVDVGALGTMTISAEAPITTEADAGIVAGGGSDDEMQSDRFREAIIDADGKTKPEVIAKRKKKAAKETAKLDAEIKARLAEKRAARAATEKAASAPAMSPDAKDGESEVDYQHRRLAEKEAARQTVEEVETERGRVFEAGAEPVVEDVTDESPTITFAKPSDAAPELEENRLGYKIISLGADGKPDPKKKKALARVTTFVNNIDDETTLKKWDKRMVVEGLAADLPSEDPLISRVADIAHRRDVKVEKAIRQDRKGKLGIGEVGEITRAAEKEAKDALDKIVEEAAEIAGRHKKAKAGSHLHRLAEISDAEGIDAVRQIHEAGLFVSDPETGDETPITATDLASTEAYAEAMTRLGAKVLHSEAIIVNDAMGYAGRLDRIITAKLPELTVGGVVRPADQRARRYVTDIKSGRIDLGAGKIARQLSAYALGDLYDPETGERSRHSAARDVALVFHLPQGDGVCTVHAVDLKAGAALLKLSAEVRRARNTGKKTIDAGVNVIDLLPEIEA